MLKDSFYQKLLGNGDMDIKEWEKERKKEDVELVNKCLDRIREGKQINLTEQLVPEFRDLQGKSYTILTNPLNHHVVKRVPHTNLNTLITSNLYDSVIVHFRPASSKTALECMLGLGKIGCGISFEGFKDLIERGKVKIEIDASPELYNKDFFKDIFRVCQKKGYLPPFCSSRISMTMQILRLASIAMAHEIPPTDAWMYSVLKIHPEYGIDGCRKDISKVLDETVLENIRRRELWQSNSELLDGLATCLLSLRVYGFDSLAQLSLECIEKIGGNFGCNLMRDYKDFLTIPLSHGLQGYMNYNLVQVNRMSFLKLVDDKLASLWRDVLTASPLNSSSR
jgi:hypothetical protein